MYSLKRSKQKRIILIMGLIIMTGFFLPQKFVIPVEGASNKDWNEKSFWYYPWGKSITHKGVDIFAAEGKNVLSSTPGIVVYKGWLKRGGNVIVILGPKWRLHYYAHLKEIQGGFLHFTKSGKPIGKVGKTGNAKNTPPHLHYSMITIIPYIWRIDTGKQGWAKMFFLNPLDYLK